MRSIASRSASSRRRSSRPSIIRASAPRRGPGRRPARSPRPGRTPVARRAWNVARGRWRGSSSGGTSPPFASSTARYRRAPSPTHSLPAAATSSGETAPAPGTKTSPRRASITGNPPSEPSASASSVETPAPSMPSASARPRAVARPILVLVKLPGPVPTTSASRSRGRAEARRRSASTSSSRVFATEARSPRTSPSSRSALVATSVAVSKARTSTRRFFQQRPVCRVDEDAPDVRRDVLEPDMRPWLRQNTGPGLRPLDEHDRVLEVRLEVAPLRRREAAKAVEVEMGDVDRPAVAVADRERRARDTSRDAERAAGPADERRLARTELARDEDDVTGRESAGEPRPRPPRSLRPSRSRPRGTPFRTARAAPAAAPGPRRAAMRAARARRPARERVSNRHSLPLRRPSSCGSRATSRSSTSSMVGV